VVTELLKRLVPAPLRQPMRGVVLSLIPPLRRRLRRTWRRRNRLKRRIRRGRYRIKLRVQRIRSRLIGRVRRRHNRLRRKLLKVVKKVVKEVWGRQLKQRIWLRIWRIHIWRGRNSPVESSDQIHLISALQRLPTGTTLRTLHLYDELKNRAEVSLWTEHKSVPSETAENDPVAENYPVKRIVPERFEFPKTGTFVFVGTSFRIGPWHRYTYPRRVILVHNSHMLTARQFRRKLWQLSNKGRRKVEVAYASELMKKSAGNYPGLVQASLIDLDRFVPAASKKPSDSASASFIVGRLSRAAPFKHHPDDPVLYRRLVEHGCRIRIMGPSPSLEAQLRGLESVTLLPKYAQEAHLFLQGLDCFFYRTSEEYLEPSARVVTEAMACGLPVVCHSRGGYVEWIDEGRNGFLFETQQEALEILLLLKEDPALRERVGKAARRTAEELFSADVRSEIVEFYLH
jgi:glycosyltransferase involved in cell wall biosynthesis